LPLFRVIFNRKIGQSITQFAVVVKLTETDIENLRV